MDTLERFIKILILTTFLMLICEMPYHITAKTSQQTVIEDLVDIKDFKKLLRTKNNVLICFISSARQSSSIIKVFRDAASAIKGQGTMVLIDCSAEAKKLCKKLKVSPDPYVIKHYKDGDFHKDYDRKETAVSMLNFMKDPTGDIPWEEDSAAADILHIPDVTSLTRLLKRETGPLMVMFYAPWCGFCKQLKPEYSAAALQLKGHSTLAAIDVNRPHNSAARTQYNITGFPTLIYFENGVKKFNYEGDNNKDSIIKFMKNPSATPPKPVESDWSESETAKNIYHLTEESFDQILGEEESALVMFYAPWCGHCKKMKPEYEKAADTMKKEGISGILAAVDATKYNKIGQRFKITSYPTVKYLKKGNVEFDISLRDSSKILDFMKDPKEPPPPPPPEKPWAEEPSEVVHLTVETFKPFLKKKKHVLVMFYAPWCGHCKKAKPEFTSAAEEFKDDSKIEFAAVDCTTQSGVCSVHDVKGYPTIKYFNYLNRQPPQDYTGGRTQADFGQFMRKFSGSVSKKGDEGPKDSSDNPDWEKKILHLTADTYKSTIAKHKSILVFFHAQWCDNCKVLKKPFVEAAKELQSAGVTATLAAVDVSTNEDLAEEEGVLKLPHLKYFREGVMITTYSGGRTTKDIVSFMKNPPKEKPSGKTKEEL